MILAIRTDSATAELYLINGAKVEQKIIWQAERELSVQLLSKIQGLLHKAKIEFKDIKGVVVYKGPGSFTGLRLGVAAANSLANGLGIPIVGATGKDWRDADLKSLTKAEIGSQVVPEYGAEPNITKPKK